MKVAIVPTRYSPPVDFVATEVLHMADLVLVMSVNPGFSGQFFLPKVLPKLTVLRNHLEKVNPAVHLEIDGGINAKTLPLALNAGANVFVASSAIFDYSSGIAAGIQQLRTHFPVKYKKSRNEP